MGAERRRRGVALLAALVTLAVVGTLLVAGYYSARADIDRGAAASRSAQLAAGADGALEQLAASWDSAARFRQAVGTTSPLPVGAADSHAGFRAWATRLDARLYWIGVELTDLRDSSLVARRGAPLCVAAPDFPPDTAGLDPDHLGNDSFATLAARAALALPAGASVPAPVSNLAYAAGDLTVTGGAGSGVLLVAGDLTLFGPGSYRGVILATGRILVGMAGMSVDGRVLSVAGNDPKILAGIELRDNPAIVADAEWHAGVVRFAPGPGASPGC